MKQSEDTPFQGNLPDTFWEILEESALEAELEQQ